MIHYTESTERVSAHQLQGFFVGWPTPPSRATHLEILEGSDNVILAIDDQTGNVVGFVTAVTDGVLTAFIPLLEVLPEYRHQGIGTELLRRMLKTLKDFYSIDLICDADMTSFYKALGMTAGTGMTIRNYKKATGK